ncbi:MAG: RHS repeat-associated core domain-containing protein [Labilithrix sp.]|nr:RHS repeat-associated core domain-containing protein [Labilithrix sp.]
MAASDGTTVASRVTYAPWGKVAETGSGARSDFGFTGHYFDRSTDLSLTLYRGYDTNSGRWLSKDPIGLLGGPNLYAYANNDPTNYTDPYGLDVYDCTVTFAGVLPHYYSCVVTQGHEYCYGHGQTSVDHYDPDRCTRVSRDPCMDSCMEQEMGQAGMKADYSFFSNNCGQKRGDMKDKCKKQCGHQEPEPSYPPIPPRWFPWWFSLF